MVRAVNNIRMAHEKNEKELKEKDDLIRTLMNKIKNHAYEINESLKNENARLKLILNNICKYFKIEDVSPFEKEG